jgi:hypothetical protein
MKTKRKPRKIKTREINKKHIFSWRICGTLYPALAYVYILFYAMIKEADMRLSSDVSMCRIDEKHIFDIIKRRNQISGHRKIGCAVGIPRLVNSASERRKPEKEL